MQTLNLIIVCSLAGYGFNLMIQRSESMIFGFYQQWLIHWAEISKIGKYLSKPLGLCVTCNSTWIGILSAWYFHYDLISIILTGCATAALATIISSLHHLINRL